MLINNIANINVALKKKSLIIFEKYNSQLIRLLNILWKKKLIIGYTLVNTGIKIVLKYNKSEPLIKSLQIVSKPGTKKYKKLKEKNHLYILSNSHQGICIVDTLNKDTLYGKMLFRIIF